jgi:hypothetical protein
MLVLRLNSAINFTSLRLSDLLCDSFRRPVPWRLDRGRSLEAAFNVSWQSGLTDQLTPNQSAAGDQHRPKCFQHSFDRFWGFHSDVT